MGSRFGTASGVNSGAWSQPAESTTTYAFTRAAAAVVEVEQQSRRR
jgi:hypothetical protein